MKTRQKKIALIGLPILQSVNNLLNAAVARHAEQVGNWQFIFSAQATVEAFRAVRKLDCDGAIVRVTSPAMRYEAMQIRFPIVNLSSWLENSGVPTVRPDWRMLGRMAAEHLLEKGYRRFGCVIVPGGWYIQERYTAFAETLRAHGITASLFHLRTTPPDSPEPMAKAERARFKNWVRELSPPAAIALMDDWDAPVLMDVCREAGFQIPRDIVMLSTGIHSEIMPLCHPPLSGAQEDLETQADLTIKCLEDQIAGKRTVAALVVVPPVGVIERVSTATMAIEDREVAHAVELIRAHGCEPVNVAGIAARVSVCRATLERRFSQVMGLTPHEYLLQQRILRAQELLAVIPPLSLQAISRRCGIPDRRRLNRIFRRVTGKSPAAFRKAAKKLARGAAG
ncbi:MAG: transcriptional regulator [Pedosphaera sp.]|nr:transcriptional regulator [Pedosphaera sp.]